MRRCGVMQELLRGAAGWCALLYSTHYMDEADALADDIAVLAAGRLACHGSSLALKVPRPLAFTRARRSLLYLPCAGLLRLASMHPLQQP